MCWNSNISYWKCVIIIYSLRFLVNNAYEPTGFFVSSGSLMETTVSKLSQLQLIVQLKSEPLGTLTNSLSFEASNRQCFHVYEFSGLDSRVSSLFSGAEGSEIIEKKKFLSTGKCLKLLSFGIKQIKVNFGHLE